MIKGVLVFGAGVGLGVVIGAKLALRWWQYTARANSAGDVLPTSSQPTAQATPAPVPTTQTATPTMSSGTQATTPSGSSLSSGTSGSGSGSITPATGTSQVMNFDPYSGSSFRSKL